MFSKIKNTKLTKRLSDILNEYNASLTMLDIGASGAPYKPFEIANKITGKIIEVDPDSRDFETSKFNENKIVKVTKAICENDNAESITLYLTENSHCTSTLKGDREKLANFPYSDYFNIVDSQEVQATSLNNLSKELNCSFNWIKLDTQGTELRIIESMSDELFNSVLAIDAEISFYRHYLDADWLPSFHTFLDKKGFYISDIINIQERIRLTKEDLNSLKTHVYQPKLKHWPTSPEFRYIKALDANKQIEIPISNFLILWSIAFLTKNWPYCYFLCNRYKETANHDKHLLEELSSIVITAISSVGPMESILKRSLNRLGRYLTKL